MTPPVESLFVKAQNTTLPKSLRPTSPPPDNVPKHKHVKDLKLRTKLNRQAAHAARSKTLVEDAELLLTSEAGQMQVETELERTWRIGQADIVQSAGQEAAKGRRELKLDGGPYRSRYSRNGRHLAIVGNMGHVATFDWQTGTMHAELQLQETCRDITYVVCYLHITTLNRSIKIFAGSVILRGRPKKICIHIRP
jgi:U3 small nucleolar RNA-associated protein 7